MAKAKPQSGGGSFWAGLRSKLAPTTILAWLRSQFAFTAVASLAILITVLYGFWSIGVSNSGIRHNMELADFGNKLLLLNAVRASKHYPLYFTAFGDAKASRKTQFGGDKDGASVAVEGGVSDLSIISQNNAAFQRLLLAEIDTELFRVFIQNNWPKDVLFNVLVHKISMPRDVDKRIGGAIAAFCSEVLEKRPNTMSADRCYRLAQDWKFLKDNCPGVYGAAVARTGRYYNAGDHECDQMMFQIIISEMRILGFDFEQENIEGKFSENRKIIKIDGGGAKKTEIYLEKGKSISNYSWKIGVRPQFSEFQNAEIDVELRSPLTIIQYLGALIRAQLHIEGRFTPTIVYGGNFDRHNLFVVKCRSSVLSVLNGLLGSRSQKNCSWFGSFNSVLSVEHEGMIYYIPRPDYGSAMESRSLEVLDLLHQVMVRLTVRGFK